MNNTENPAWRSPFLKVLQERGAIHQISDGVALDAAAGNGVVTGYIGFDATADSLHIGNLVGIMLLRRLQQTDRSSCLNRVSRTSPKLLLLG